MNRSDEMLLWWLSMCPWASARDLAEFAQLTVSTVNRRLDALYEQGKAVSRIVGRGDRAKRRWILASEYLERKYATGHRHGGIQELRTIATTRWIPLLTAIATCPGP